MMAKTTWHVILVCLGLTAATIIYFLTLCLNLPVYVAVVLFAASCMACYRSRKYLMPSEELAGTPLDNKGLLALAIGLIVIAYKGYGVEEKYGHWDAWWFWNVRANYLTRPNDWRLAFSGRQYGTMFTVPVAHSDYPPFLPLLNGFCWRLMRIQPVVVPFFWSLISLLIIPTVIFVEVYQRNKLVGILSLFYLVMQEHLIRLGVGQTADGWIAVFTLLAAVAFQHFLASGDKAYAFLMAALLGCALWTKNEGLIIAVTFTAFTLKAVIRGSALRHFLLGLGIPLLALILFKLLLAPPNDIINAQNTGLLEKVFNAARYGEIRRLLWDMILLFYPSLPYILAAYFVALFLEKQLPDKIVIIVFSCFTCYLAGYLISPHNLGWHVNTSSDRLIFQLMPTFVWAVAVRFRRMRFLPEPANQEQ